MLPTPVRRRHAQPLGAVAAVAALVLLAGCGSSGPRRLDLADARSLQGALAAVRTSARMGERGAVLDGLAALDARVQRLEASGALAAPDASGMRADIAGALAAARRELAPAPVIVPAPPVVEPPPDHAHEHGKDHAHPDHPGEGHSPGRHRGDGGKGRE